MVLLLSRIDQLVLGHFHETISVSLYTIGSLDSAAAYVLLTALVRIQGQALIKHGRIQNPLKGPYKALKRAL